jgi:hypothetical protein
MSQLIGLGTTTTTTEVGPRSLLGNNIVDRFTFVARLETRGKYDLSFFDFLERLEEFREKKKFIRTMLEYYSKVKNKNGQMHPHRGAKEVYNICISAINILKPLNYMELFTRYTPVPLSETRVLHFCCGWGGGSVAATALQLRSYVGIERNESLKEPYQELLAFLQPYHPNTDIDVHFTDATTFDYSTLHYHLAFSSPPYYFIQKYQNNPMYVNKDDMDKQLYVPLFRATYGGLAPGGVYLINVCAEVYTRVLVPLFGPAHEITSLKKSQRQNSYQELVYVWRKGGGGGVVV